MFEFQLIGLDNLFITDQKDAWLAVTIISRVRQRNIREGVKKKPGFFRTLSQTMGRWGSKVLNFLVKIHIQLFLLQTSRNVLKHIIHKWGGHIWPFYDDLRPQFLLAPTGALLAAP